MINPAFAEICAAPRGALTGKFLQDFLALTAGDQAWLTEALGAANDTTFNDSAREMQLRNLSGEPVPVLLTMRPLEAGSRQRLAFAGSAHDLRLQKQQQAALQLAYEEVAAARGALEKLNLGLEQLVPQSKRPPIYRQPTARWKNRTPPCSSSTRLSRTSFRWFRTNCAHRSPISAAALNCCSPSPTSSRSALKARSNASRAKSCGSHPSLKLF